MVYFASPKTHEKIQETKAVTNDEIILTKTQLETGKSWITVERPGKKSATKPQVKDVPLPISDSGDDRQKVIDSSWAISNAVKIWLALWHDEQDNKRAERFTRIDRLPEQLVPLARSLLEARRRTITIRGSNYQVR